MKTEKGLTEREYSFATKPDSREQIEYRIPKRIIQTGKYAQQPLHIRAMSSNIKLVSPDYGYLFFGCRHVETGVGL